jgi:cyclopropane fatty-acyl-phospholipid synthase-like methyltransferase
LVTMTGVDQSPIYRSSYHSAHLTEDASRAVLWSVLAEYLSCYISPDAHVLELGAGYCHWINNVHAKVKTAVDLWEDLPKHAAADVKPVVHDLSQGLGIFQEKQFDAVLASNLIEHFKPDDASRIVADIFRVLRSQGRLIVIQPNFCYAYRQYFDDYTHRSVFTHVSLPNLMRSHGFQIEAVQAKFTPYSLRNSRIRIRPWLIRAYLHSPVRPFAGQMLVVAQKTSQF